MFPKGHYSTSVYNCGKKPLCMAIANFFCLLFLGEDSDFDSVHMHHVYSVPVMQYLFENVLIHSCAWHRNHGLVIRISTVTGW